MADLRRRSAGPPPRPPQIQLTPGLGEQTLRELAPLPAADGIDAWQHRACPTWTPCKRP